MTKEGYFKKYEYVYDEANDIYICPNNCDKYKYRLLHHIHIHIIKQTIFIFVPIIVI